MISPVRCCRCPGLKPANPADDVIWVPIFSDLKLRDIASGDAADFNRENLEMNQTTRTERFQLGRGQ